MNTKEITENVLSVLEKYNFITEYPIDVNQLSSEIECEIIKGIYELNSHMENTHDA